MASMGKDRTDGIFEAAGLDSFEDVPREGNSHTRLEPDGAAHIEHIVDQHRPDVVRPRRQPKHSTIHS